MFLKFTDKKIFSPKVAEISVKSLERNLFSFKEKRNANR